MMVTPVIAIDLPTTPTWADVNVKVTEPIIAVVSMHVTIRLRSLIDTTPSSGCDSAPQTLTTATQVAIMAGKSCIDGEDRSVQAPSFWKATSRSRRIPLRTANNMTP